MPNERSSRRPPASPTAATGRRFLKVVATVFAIAFAGGLAALVPGGSSITGSTPQLEPARPFAVWPHDARPPAQASATTSTAGSVDGAEPAIARAAEQGLEGMRDPFAQSVQPARPDPERFAKGTPPAAADGSRDARDPLARPAAAAPPPPRAVTLRPGTGRPTGAPTVTPLGHATVLLQVDGFTVLTDPNFLRRGEHARLLGGLAWPRQTDPALEFEQLPPVDLVLLSSLREDRFDRTVRRLLPRETPIVAPVEARGALVAMGFSSVHGLGPGQTLRLEKSDAWLALTATPTRARPAVLAHLLPASNGSLLAFGRGKGPAERRVWISGDTRVDDALLERLSHLLEGVDLALLHRAGSATLGLITTSLDAAEARRLVSRLRPFEAIALRVDDHDAGPPRIVGITLPARASNAAAAHAVTMDRLAGEPREVPRGATHVLERPERWASGPDRPATH
jgi:L-ascorbate metabolism protein UlaG (beta-lactamase superfamily)